MLELAVALLSGIGSCSVGTASSSCACRFQSQEMVRLVPHSSSRTICWRGPAAAAAAGVGMGCQKEEEGEVVVKEGAAGAGVKATALTTDDDRGNRAQIFGPTCRHSLLALHTHTCVCVCLCERGEEAGVPRFSKEKRMTDSLCGYSFLVQRLSSSTRAPFPRCRCPTDRHRECEHAPRTTFPSTFLQENECPAHGQLQQQKNPSQGARIIVHTLLSLLLFLADDGRRRANLLMSRSRHHHHPTRFLLPLVPRISRSQ